VTFFYLLAQVDISSGEDADVNGNFLHAAQVHKTFSLAEHAGSLACVSIPMVPNFIEEERALSATSKRPFLERWRLVKAPFTCPKRVDSSRSPGMKPVLTGTKGWVFLCE